jgi:hypothetical protein
MSGNTLEIVNAWVAAANTQDVTRLLDLSAANIEIVGPRGSGFGQQLLREWLSRAGLSLHALRSFARGSVVVQEQRGVWRSDETGQITGERTLASLFETDGQRVVKYARLDTLDEALQMAGLLPSDEVQ